MNPRRTVLALALALCVSGLLTWSVAHSSKTKVLVEPPLSGRILVASRDVAIGEVLNDENMVLRDWASREMLPGALAAPAAAVGRVALFPLASGEPILLRKLAEQGSGQGISATIPRGMRAVTVHGPDVGIVSHFLAPGDLVDVLTTYHQEGVLSSASSTVLQAVRVFAVGERTSPAHDREAMVADNVTLLVPSPEVPKLNLAIASGRILFALRNRADTAMDAVDEPAFTKNRAPVTAMHSVPEPKTPLPASASGLVTVETIAGGKLTSQTFEEPSR